MQCFVANTDVRLFSQYRFKNGEVRPLLQTPGSMLREMADALGEAASAELNKRAADAAQAKKVQ